jgi:hypothetical protein
MRYTYKQLVEWLRKHTTIRGGSVNQIKIGSVENQRWFPCPTGVTSGMPVLIGNIAAVAMDAYDASTGGTTFYTDGSYTLTVIAQSQISPTSGVQINTGATIYASGTLDPTTNVTYNLTLDVTRGNAPFGVLDAGGPILSGTTSTTAVVRLLSGGWIGSTGSY